MDEELLSDGKTMSLLKLPIQASLASLTSCSTGRLPASLASC